MNRLRERLQAQEQMDDPALAGPVYDRVLSDLARINLYTLAARPTLSFLRRATRGVSAFRLLDVGFGHGDMLRRIARWASQQGIAADLIGVDLNPRSAVAARAATPGSLGIDYRTGDYREVEGRIDFVISSLVAHHMELEEIVAFLGFMEKRAARAWLVNDLHRHRVAHAAYPWIARAAFVHPIVRQDGRTSIARSFRPADWQELIGRAGIDRDAVRIRRYFPFRLCVERLH